MATTMKNPVQVSSTYFFYILSIHSCDYIVYTVSTNLVEREQGIQWETLRDFITWKGIGDSEGQIDEVGGTCQGPPELPDSSRIRLSKLSAIPNVSFDELSNCVVKIPRKRINEKLTSFIRLRHQEESEVVVSHWLRMMKMDVMEDIYSIIDSFYVDIECQEDPFPVYANWIVRDKEQSSPQRRLNRCLFFKELQSIADEKDITDIVGVAVFLAKTVKGYSYWHETTTTLHLNANGSYVFEENGYDAWAEGEAESDSEYEVTRLLKHCGVWDYKGDEIVMEGFGIEDTEGGYHCESSEDEDEDETERDTYFSSKLAIQRPVLVKQTATCEQWFESGRCDKCERSRGGIRQKCRKTEKCNLSVFVYF